MNPLGKVLKIILSNPYTTLIGGVAIGVLVVYSKTMTIPELVQYIILAVGGLLAKDTLFKGDSNNEDNS